MLTQPHPGLDSYLLLIYHSSQCSEPRSAEALCNGITAGMAGWCVYMVVKQYRDTESDDIKESVEHSGVSTDFVL